MDSKALPTRAGMESLKSYAGRRVAVAGVTGFIGINTAIALRQAGAHVIGFARHESPLAATVCHKLLVVDLEVAGAVDAALQDVSIVFDCLGYPALAPSDLVPESSLEAEFRPHLNLFLSCATQSPPILVVHVSTRLVYGSPLTLPVNEAHPLNPGSLYSAHKLLVEHYIKTLAKTHGLPAIVFRLSSPYGPNGPSSPGRLGVWNQFIQKALRNETLTIYGEGDQLRDFVHIDDITRVFLIAAATEACVGEVFNFGGERAMPLREAVTIIAEEAGGVEVKYIPWPNAARKVETGDYFSDLAKIRQFINLPPQITFRAGVRRTIAVMRGEVVDLRAWPRRRVARMQGEAGAVPAMAHEDFEGQRVLVVGASGFVGVHLVRRLLDEGAEVIALSRTCGRLAVFERHGSFTFEPCDLTSVEATEAAVMRAAPDIVIHAAAFPDGEESANLIRSRLAVNVVGLLNILEACRTHAPEARIVYGDSRKVYGDAVEPHSSGTTAAPLCSYAVAKEAGWNLCKLYSRLHGMTVVSVRPSLIYGPGQGVNLIRAVAEAAQRGEATIRLKGGEQTRDPLYIDDAVDAFLEVARRAKLLTGRTLVIGGREELPVRDIAQLVLNVCDSSATVVCDAEMVRPTEVRRSICDLSEAAELLEWSPRFELYEGLTLTLQPAATEQRFA